MSVVDLPRPALWLERKERLEQRLAEQDAHIARIEALQERSDDPSVYSESLGALLKQSAETVGHLQDIHRESVILFFEREEREKASMFGHATPRVELGSSAVGAGPKGLEEKSLEEIIYVLRTKQKWTWQQIVDWLHAKGVKRPRGGTEWHTSAVYAIHKKGFSPARTA